MIISKRVISAEGTSAIQQKSPPDFLLPPCRHCPGYRKLRVWIGTIRNQEADS
ncbi:hypothetical protein [Novipirellula rosea]|uniref:hypothetical protein n=1 Tax=Novipirellula rosea TaxID=1031540 RepID=UPI0031ED69E2